jgi:basic membrane protein A
MKKSIAFLVVLSFVFGLTICYSAAIPKIGFVTGTGGLGDKGLNDLTYAGVQKFNKNQAQIDVVEPKEIADCLIYIKKFAQAKNYAVIVGVSFDNQDAITAVAPEYPNQKFIICDSVVNKPNVTSAGFKAEQTGWQMGTLAGLLVKKGKLPNARNKNSIGFIGGMDVPLINEFAAGYFAGAKYVNPDINIFISYVGSFADPSKATELATGMYDRGADIILNCAGGSGLGIFTAAKKVKGYALGLETNQNSLAPDNIIASATRQWATLVYDLTNAAISGKLKSGVITYGIKEKSLKIERSGSNITVEPAIMNQTEDLCQMVAGGKLVLPSELKGVDGFIAKYGHLK